MTRLAAPDLDSPPLARYGLPEAVAGAAPAAGDHFSVSLGGDFLVRLVSVIVTLTTDSNAANRGLVLEYRDAGGNRLSVDGAPVAQTASTATAYHFTPFRDENVWPVDSSVLCKLSPLLLVPTWSWRLYVANVQVGDTLTDIRYVQERFYTHAQPVRNAPRPGD